MTIDQPLRIAFVAAFVAAGVATAPVDGQSSRSNPGETFGELIEVNLVNVDVVVTDPQGRPVSGLTPADFRVFDDGEPVEISHFR